MDDLVVLATSSLLERWRDVQRVPAGLIPEKVFAIGPMLVASAAGLLLENPGMGMSIDAADADKQILGPFEKRFRREKWSQGFSDRELTETLRWLLPSVVDTYMQVTV